MKRFYFIVIAISLFFVAQMSVAQDRKFGLGIILGEPTGLTAKYWTSPTTAWDFAFGTSVGGDRIGSYNGYYDGGTRLHFHVDYLWHSFDAIKSTERFPIYYGIGGRINTGAGYNSSAAVRGVIGIAWMPRQTPIDIFLEIVP